MKRISMHFFFLTILVGVPLILLGAPSISSVSGTPTQGQVITITGNSFGAHAKYSSSDKSYLCRFYDDFESGKINYNTNYWDCGSADGARIDSSTINRPGSSYAVKQGNNGGGIGHKADYTKNVLYMAGWRWINNEVLPGGDSTNWKIFRVWPYSGNQDFLLMIFDPEWTEGTCFWYLENYSTGTNWFDFPDNYLRSWHLYELLIDKSGNFKFWFDGQLIANQAPKPDWGSWTPYEAYFDAFHAGTGGVATTYIYSDDLYIDHTQARVMIGNASTIAASTHREIQIPTAWSSGSISVKFNKGSFSAGNTVYLYVFDQNGAVNSTGYPITIGQSGGGGGGTDTTPPAQPGGIRVQVQ